MNKLTPLTKIALIIIVGYLIVNYKSIPNLIGGILALVVIYFIMWGILKLYQRITGKGAVEMVDRVVYGSWKTILIKQSFKRLLIRSIAIIIFLGVIISALYTIFR